MVSPTASGSQSLGHARSPSGLSPQQTGTPPLQQRPLPPIERPTGMRPPRARGQSRMHPHPRPPEAQHYYPTEIQPSNLPPDTNNPLWEALINYSRDQRRSYTKHRGQIVPCYGQLRFIKEKLFTDLVHYPNLLDLWKSKALQCALENNQGDCCRLPIRLDEDERYAKHDYKQLLGITQQTDESMEIIHKTYNANYNTTVFRDRAFELAKLRSKKDRMNIEETFGEIRGYLLNGSQAQISDTDQLQVWKSGLLQLMINPQDYIRLFDLNGKPNPLFFYKRDMTPEFRRRAWVISSVPLTTKWPYHLPSLLPGPSARDLHLQWLVPGHPITHMRVTAIPSRLSITTPPSNTSQDETETTHISTAFEVDSITTSDFFDNDSFFNQLTPQPQEDNDRLFTTPTPFSSATQDEQAESEHQPKRTRTEEQINLTNDADFLAQNIFSPFPRTRNGLKAFLQTLELEPSQQSKYDTLGQDALDDIDTGTRDYRTSLEFFALAYPTISLEDIEKIRRSIKSLSLYWSILMIQSHLGYICPQLYDKIKRKCDIVATVLHPSTE